MAERTGRLCGAAATFKRTQQDNRRVRDGVRKLREALEADAKATAARGSGLPGDWRSRILK